MFTHQATCRTPDCTQDGVTVELNDPGEYVSCGGCGQWITEIEPPLPTQEVPDDSV